jgi:hypothetical protein
MVPKRLIGLVFVGALAFSAASAEVIVRITPPAAIVETQGAAPGPGYVWVAGYQRWDGNAFGWTPGVWQQAPHPGARWVAHRWVRRHGGWVMVEGRWR